MRDLVLLLFVAGTLPMALVRPIIGLLLWMMFSYLNPHRLTWGFASGLPWVMLIAVVTFFALASHADQRQAPLFKPTTVLMLLFLVVVTISTSQAVMPDRAFNGFDQFAKMLAMAFVTTMLVTDREKLQWVIWVIVASFGFWGFKGGLFTVMTGGSYTVMGPPRSFFHDNNQFALIMCMIIPLMRYVQLYTTRRWLRQGMWVVIGLTAISAIGTYSRGGFLALSIVGCMLIIKSRRRLSLLVLAPALIAAIVSLMPAQYFNRIGTIDNYQQDSSAQGRIDSWKFATNLALARPWFGGGIDVWASDAEWNRHGPPGAKHRAIHSIFFEVLGEQGFIGLVLFIGLLLAGYLGLARVRKQARAGPKLAWLGDLASMLQVSLIAYAVAGVLLPMPYIDLLYQMLALVAVMQVLVQRESAQAAAVERKLAPIGRGQNARRPNGYKPTTQRYQRPPVDNSDRSTPADRDGLQNLPPW